MRVICGWCRHPTPPGPCDYCGRNAAQPWLQRGMVVPAADHDSGSGRPSLDARAIRLAYDAARAELGPDASIEAIAEKLDRSPRTVRAWKQRFAL